MFGQLGQATMAGEPEFAGRTVDNPLDADKLDEEGFVAMRFLMKHKDTPFEKLGTLDQNGVKRSREYLMESRSETIDSVFKEKRASEQLDVDLRAPDGPFVEATKVDYIKLDITGHVSEAYDFKESAFPFTPSPNDRFSIKKDLFDPNHALNVALFSLKFLPVDPEKAEKWVTNKGKAFAVCKVGKGFEVRQFGVMQSVKVSCESIIFVSSAGDLITTIKTPAPLMGIDTD